MFFALLSPFSGEGGFTKFVSEEITAARARQTSRRRRIPMPTSPRHRARYDRHEARAGIVALISCCLVHAANTCRGAALASRLHRLTFSGDNRGHSKALVFAVLKFQIQNLSVVHAKQETGNSDDLTW